MDFHSPIQKRAQQGAPFMALPVSDTSLQEFDSVSISIASPEQIRSWSYGEVKKPETINYRTFKPERDGLFCARIFGPVKDFECLCGKYKRMKYRGMICEKCGVEVTQSKVRRERMGHIELAAPVAHIWFSKSLPSRIGVLLDMNTRNLDRILYFDGYVVLDAGLTTLEDGQVLSEDEYSRAQIEFGSESFRVGTGAAAVKEMLSRVNLASLREELRAELAKEPSEMRRKKVVRRLKLVEAFLSQGARPEWMVLDVLPVMPPDLRPLVPLDGGRFATADLNDLYRRLLNRNNRLKRLIELCAPEMIIRNEKRMLQEIVDAFFDNGRRGRPIVGSNKRPLKSLSDILKGKNGRFRMNLLGKRVDYSGRSVIVVGPELKLHQCGVPKKMALELFKPFVYSRLERYGFASTIKAAKRMVERERPEVWDILEEVIKGRPVLLNRAPTLHRLGIQAFEPILVEGKAIQLHPLVCAAFNADFDGDQMAIHVPLSLEAQTEARVLMLSTNNMLHPMNGAPITVPSREILLGIYYLMIERDGELGEGKAFANLNEVLAALDAKAVSLHAKIHARYPVVLPDGTHTVRRAQTTPGRLILWDVLPRHPRITFDRINRKMVSKDIVGLVGWVHRCCGQSQAALFADKIVQLGFKHATLSGISFGKDDLLVPKEKPEIVEQTYQVVKESHQQYLDGLITSGERYNKVMDAWTKCTEKIATKMMDMISQDVPGKPLNSIYMMITSGARGSPAQMKQLAAMRGLIARHDGTIIEHPIISNFCEGLHPSEYFNATHGSRKGLSDLALKTANAGYLTRRLVDVAQDCVITKDDCGTKKGIRMSALMSGSEVIMSLEERILGLVAAEDITDPSSGDVLVKRNELITEDHVEKIQQTGLTSAYVRSVLSCEATEGLCALCYGRDLTRGILVTPGEAVGIIAAQSIGEPGMQLTMRTFHSGGAAQVASETALIEAPCAGVVELRNKGVIQNRQGQMLVTNRHMDLIVKDSKGKETGVYRIPYGAVLLVEEGAKVEAGQKLAEWDSYTVPVIAESDGVIQYMDLVEGASLKEMVDESTGIAKRIVTEWRQSARKEDLQPRLVLKKEGGAGGRGNRDVRYALAIDTIILVENGAEVRGGDILARLARETSKSRDIVGGLPRIAELFEARQHRDPAIMCECDGIVEFGKDHKVRRHVIVVPHDPTLKPFEYVIPKGKHPLVQEGEQVRKGDILVDGGVVPHDILRILGVEALATYLVKEIQDVYRLQGVKINDKHIEVIIRQMLRKKEVVDPGDTMLLIGDQVDNDELEEVNTRAEKEGGRLAIAVPVLQGITRASLQTKSFISAASFQETTRVLIEAAVNGKKDRLTGLKENVIVGRLIPAGTGAYIRHLREQARERDVLAYHQAQELALGPKDAESAFDEKLIAEVNGLSDASVSTGEGAAE